MILYFIYNLDNQLKEKVTKMAENKLPSGVGKKIVQALKKQAEIEIQPVPDKKENIVSLEDEATIQPEIYDNVASDNVSLDDEFSDFSMNDNSEINTLPDMELSLNSSSNDSFDETYPTTPKINFEETDTHMFEEKEAFPPTQKLNMTQPQNNYSMPANVAVLKRLIMQLPQGVSKQTGAQIIRQTMEALGISMNSVLKEAQQGQDSITASAKACMSTIAEYRNHIKNLEKQVQDYKKQAVALNDLISLFVMTDKHN